MFVDDHAPAFFTESIQSQFELRATVASQAMKHIASKTFGMNPYKGRGAGQVTETKNYSFFDARRVLAFKAEYAEVAETAWKVRFCYFDELEFRGDNHQEIKNPGF
jgi:hypothetical protein